MYVVITYDLTYTCMNSSQFCVGRDAEGEQKQLRRVQIQMDGSKFVLGSLENAFNISKCYFSKGYMKTRAPESRQAGQSKTLGLTVSLHHRGLNRAGDGGGRQRDTERQRDRERETEKGGTESLSVRIHYLQLWDTFQYKAFMISFVVKAVKENTIDVRKTTAPCMLA